MKLKIKFVIYGCNLNLTHMIKMSPPTIHTLYQPIIKRDRNENLDITLEEIIFCFTFLDP